MDTPQTPKISVPQVRTFKSDAAHASGGEPVSSARTVATPPITAAPQSALPPETTHSHEHDSHLTDKQGVFNIRAAAEGTEEGIIVKDTKRNRWSLRRELGRSVKAWAEEKVGAIAELTAEPESHVAPAEKRAAIIETAGTQSHLAPADDHKVVLQKLRTFAKDAERVTGKPFTLKAGVPEATPEWKRINETPTEVAGAFLREGAGRIFQPLKQSRASRTVLLKNRENVIAKDARLAVAPTAAQTLPDRVFEERLEEKRMERSPEGRQPSIKERLIAPLPIVEETAQLESVEPETVPQPEKAAEPEQATNKSRDLAFTLPTFKNKGAETIRTLRHDAIIDVAEKKLSVARIASAEAQKRALGRADIDLRPKHSFRTALLFATPILLLMLGGGAYLATRTTPEIPATEVRIPSFFAIPTPIAVPLADNRNDFLVSLSEQVKNVDKSRGAFVQLYPTVGGEAKTPAPTSLIMDVLDVRAPGPFVRTLQEDMVLGAYLASLRAPFMIFKAKQFDTAFAGMLEWEPFMSADLAPLFGEPVRRTLDPTARTNDQTRSARFTDTSIRNYDVRILFSELGEERLLYSFIDQETIVITTTAEAFVAIVEALP